MRPIEELRIMSAHPQVEAWRRLIRHGETHESDPMAYWALYGWRPGGGSKRMFSSAAKHPRVFFILSDGRRTSAAGAYQIVSTTWDMLVRRRPKTYINFIPRTQDLAAADLTDMKDALEDVIAGRLMAAINKCQKVWTSFPGAMESRYEMDKAILVFTRWGGALSSGDM